MRWPRSSRPEGRTARRAALLLAAALLALPAAAAPTTADALDAVVRRAQAQFGIPGISVAVILGGKLVYAKGFGLADVASRAPADAQTVYPFGSISKQFTAAGVVALAAAGRLELADPVTRHVPEYWPHGDAATLEHLLRHTAGVREFWSIPAAAKLIDDPRGTIDDVMAIVAREPLVFRSGSRWSYSNSGYHLAARAIEKTTGQPYEAFLAAAFFRPLSLPSLHHCKQAPLPPRDAQGYARRQGALVVAPWENMNTARGDGGICGSAVDLARWTRALGRGEALPSGAVPMTSPTATGDGRRWPYGLGLGLLPLDGRPRASHGGSIGGFSAAAAWYPRDDLAIAVLTNFTFVPAEAIEHALARAVLGLPTPRFRDVAVPAELRRRVTGQWEIGVPGFAIEVRETNGRLRMKMPLPGWSGELRYQGGGRFVSVRAPDVEYLELGTSAPDGALTIGMGDLHWDARRVRRRP
jgi:CubicO group peptidase (beta-lactamase class C family)